MPIFGWNAANHSFEVVNNNRPGWTDLTREALLQRFMDSGFPQQISLAEFLQAHPDSFDRGVIVGLQRRHILSWDTIRRFLLAAANGFPQLDHAAAMRRIEIMRWFGQPAADCLANAFTQRQNNNFVAAANSLSDSALHAFNYPANVFIGPSPGNLGLGARPDYGEDIYSWDGNQISTHEAGLLQGTIYRGLAQIAPEMEGILRAGAAEPPGPRLRPRPQ